MGLETPATWEITIPKEEPYFLPGTEEPETETAPAEPVEVPELVPA